MAARVIAILSITASHTVPAPTAVSTAPAYIPPWRRPNINAHPTHGHNLNAGRPQADVTSRTSGTMASMTTIGNSLPPPNTYLATNAEVGIQFNQVASAQRNLGHRHSTELATQLVQDLSAEKEEIKRLQASISPKKAFLMTGGGDPSTSTPNPNLNVQQQAVLNPYAQQFAPTSASNTCQPWSMPGIRYRIKRRCSEPNTDERLKERFQPQRLRLNLNSHLETTHVALKDCQAEVDRITTLLTPTPTVTLRERSATKLLMPSEQCNLSSTVTL